MKKKIILSILISVSFIIAMTILYSLKSALLFLALILIGIILPFLPLSKLIKMIKSDIAIIRNGEKYIGRCVKYERGSRSQFSRLVVEFENNKGITIEKGYNALSFHFKYPYDITVYSLDDDSYVYSNLGFLTLLREILYFLLFFSIWLMCAFGTVHYIVEFIQYL